MKIAFNSSVTDLSERTIVAARISARSGAAGDLNLLRPPSPQLSLCPYQKPAYPPVFGREQRQTRHQKRNPGKDRQNNPGHPNQDAYPPHDQPKQAALNHQPTPETFPGFRLLLRRFHPLLHLHPESCPESDALQGFTSSSQPKFVSALSFDLDVIPGQSRANKKKAAYPATSTRTTTSHPTATSATASTRSNPTIYRCAFRGRLGDPPA